MRIAVLGGGNGSHAAAADLSDQGHEVRFWRRDAAAFGELARTRRLMLKGRPTTSRGALVAYAMPPSAAEIEIKALADLMWCSRREERGS